MLNTLVQKAFYCIESCERRAFIILDTTSEYPAVFLIVASNGGVCQSASSPDGTIQMTQNGQRSCSLTDFCISVITFRVKIGSEKPMSRQISKVFSNILDCLCKRCSPFSFIEYWRIGNQGVFWDIRNSSLTWFVISIFMESSLTLFYRNGRKVPRRRRDGHYKIITTTSLPMIPPSTPMLIRPSARAPHNTPCWCNQVIKTPEADW